MNTSASTTGKAFQKALNTVAKPIVSPQIFSCVAAFYLIAATVSIAVYIFER